MFTLHDDLLTEYNEGKRILIFKYLQRHVLLPPLIKWDDFLKINSPLAI